MASMSDFTAALDDALALADDPDSPIAQWSLDELDRSADLGSVRSACAGRDGLYEQGDFR
jgi:hypothetical protein